MEIRTPRKLKFKAWNTETKLLMRLDSIPCVRGELQLKNHILLQFTGMLDEQEDELYEMDVVYRSMLKLIIRWSVEKSGWYLSTPEGEGEEELLTPDKAGKLKRLCNFYESSKGAG